MIGLVQVGTSRGMLSMMIGSRKMTPPRMFRMVPFGDRHLLQAKLLNAGLIGVIVAHFTPTPCSWMA